MAAILCTRTEGELAEVFDTMSEIGGIEFYSFNTLSQILRHMLLKVWCLWWFGGRSGAEGSR